MPAHLAKPWPAPNHPGAQTIIVIIVIIVVIILVIIIIVIIIIIIVIIINIIDTNNDRHGHSQSAAGNPLPGAKGRAAETCAAALSEAQAAHGVH